MGSMLVPSGGLVSIPLETDGRQAKALTAWIYQPGCRVEKVELPVIDISHLYADVPCVRAAVVDVDITILNPQDFPSPDLLAEFTYLGSRVTTSEHEDTWPTRLFSIGLFHLSGPALHIRLPDLASDPVLSQNMRRPSFLISLSNPSAHVFVGYLFVPHGNENTLLPVSNAYSNPVQLRFSRELTYVIP